MKLDQPLHLRYRNVDGPIAAYGKAEPWTREMQEQMENDYEQSQEPIGPIASRLPRFTCPTYRCPTCRRTQRTIRFESLVFYADEDFHHLRPMGEAQLITMVDCGHQYRREIAS